MQLVRWQPFDFLAQLDRELGFGAASAPRGFVPAAEVVRDGDDVVVRLEIPGIDVERDVEVTVHDGMLTIAGERRVDTSEEAEGGVVVREVRYGKFRRSLALPEGVGGEQVEASYEAGILTVRVRGANAKVAPVRVPVRAATPAAAVTAGQGTEK